MPFKAIRISMIICVLKYSVKFFLAFEQDNIAFPKQVAK